MYFPASIYKLICTIWVTSGDIKVLSLEQNRCENHEAKLSSSGIETETGDNIYVQPQKYTAFVPSLLLLLLLLNLCFPYFLLYYCL